VDDVLAKALDFQATANSISMISAITREKTAESDKVLLTATFTNTALCGGYDVLSFPVCKTEFFNHNNAIVEMKYMTDGTPASIAQDVATLREVKEPASLDWLENAMVAIMDGPVTGYQLPATVPGMINPLLYWTTSNLLAINPSLLEAGLETMYVILLRAGIQRTYSTDGSTCVRNIVLENKSTLKIEPYGLDTVLVMLSVQMILTCLSVFAFLPWIFNTAPVAPAIRAVRENIYFTTLLADSNFSDNIRNLCNAPTYAIWQGLDQVVRVGEAVDTVEEDVGRISMDKTKLVRKMVNGRKYV
jgi:hypothetical protein